MAHKAFTESFHVSPLASMVFTSSHDHHLACALSFSTVCLQVVCGLPLLLFLSGAQVIVMLQSLFLSCPIMCPIIFYLRCFTSNSSLIGFVSALCSSSSILTWFCQWICKILVDVHLQCMKDSYYSVISFVHFPCFTPI